MKPQGTLPTTLWTKVIEVIQYGNGEAAERALNEFCGQYRPVIYRFFCQRGCTHEDAEEFTQDFFASRILSHIEGRDGFLHKARRGANGRFRKFLYFVLWCFYKDKLKQ